MAAANACLRGLYMSGVWLRSREGHALALNGIRFLAGYGRLAKMAFSAGIRRFVLLPKHHFFHHIMVDMMGSSNNWVLNPLIHSVQLQEDFIGKPSRVSRRVSAKVHALRTLQRVLFAMFAEFKRQEKPR